jgi:hypothetical protein
MNPIAEPTTKPAMKYITETLRVGQNERVFRHCLATLVRTTDSQARMNSFVIESIFDTSSLNTPNGTFSDYILCLALSRDEIKTVRRVQLVLGYGFVPLPQGRFFTFQYRSPGV